MQTDFINPSAAGDIAGHWLLEYPWERTWDLYWVVNKVKWTKPFQNQRKPILLIQSNLLLPLSKNTVISF